MSFLRSSLELFGLSNDPFEPRAKLLCIVDREDDFEIDFPDKAISHFTFTSNLSAELASTVKLVHNFLRNGMSFAPERQVYGSATRSDSAPHAVSVDDPEGAALHVVKMDLARRRTAFSGLHYEGSFSELG
jgi:hypothetical protein